VRLLFLIGIPLLLWIVQRSLASPDAWGADARDVVVAIGQARCSIVLGLGVSASLSSRASAIS
jgi:hypothetical protein